MNEATIKIEGMTCGHCVRTVETKVGAIKGVDSVKVDLKAREAKVRYAESTTGIDAIVAVINDAGFEASAR